VLIRAMKWFEDATQIARFKSIAAVGHVDPDLVRPVFDR
jgi:hypothetical protein